LANNAGALTARELSTGISQANASALAIFTAALVTENGPGPVTTKIRDADRVRFFFSRIFQKLNLPGPVTGTASFHAKLPVQAPDLVCLCSNKPIHGRLLVGSKTSVVFFLLLLMLSNIWIIVLPLAIASAAQVVKALTFMAKKGRFEIKQLSKWGGFPSSHMAMVASVATIVGIVSGIASIEFLIIFSLGILVMRDASGLRMFVEQHSRAINIIRKEIPGLAKKIPQQRISIGHTDVEIVGGVLFGILLTFGYVVIFGY